MKTNKIAIAVILILMTLCAVAVPAMAEHYNYGTTLFKGDCVVTTGALNIRTRADSRSDAIGYVPCGETLKLVADSQRDSRANAWYKVAYGDTVGWISSVRARRVDAPRTGADLHTVASANIRKCPDVTSAVVCSVRAGTDLDYLNVKSKDDRGIVWYKVKTNGCAGWISSSYASF